MTEFHAEMRDRAVTAVQSLKKARESGDDYLVEVQEAQKEVLAIARRLAAEGTIQLGGKGDDYV